MREQDETGRPFPMRDPLRERLQAELLPLQQHPEACINTLFSHRELIPESLAGNRAYLDRTAALYGLLLEQGALAAAKAALSA